MYTASLFCTDVFGQCSTLFDGTACVRVWDSPPLAPVIIQYTTNTPDKNPPIDFPDIYTNSMLRYRNLVPSLSDFNLCVVVYFDHAAFGLAGGNILWDIPFPSQTALIRAQLTLFSPRNLNNLHHLFH
jgi:hypothetical protein